MILPELIKESVAIGLIWKRDYLQMMKEIGSESTRE